MAKINLTMGVDLPSPTPKEEKDRIAQLEATIEHYLPEYIKTVSAAKQGQIDDLILLHQDCFAASYNHDEYTLLGMAVKYAGLHGINVQFIGKNHETF